MRSRNRSPLICWAVLLIAVALPVHAGETAALWESIRSPELELTASVAVRDLEIDMGLGELLFTEGVLVPAAPIDGRVAELVFVGQGRFRIRPPDDLERGQLELFTGLEELDVAVDQVVLAMGNASTAGKLLHSDPVQLDDERAGKVSEAYSAWVEGALRRGFGADAGILKSVLDDAGYENFFVAWCRSDDLGEFYYVLDPTALEQVSLGQFVPIETDDLDERRIRKAIKKGQRRGRYTQLRFADLGDWDTWISTSLHNAEGKKVAGSDGLRPKRYVIDATIAPADESVEGQVRVEFQAGSPGRRLVTLSMYRDLRVNGVHDANGNELPWVRTDDTIHVVLPQEAPVDETTALSIDFGGKVLGEFEKGIFVLMSTGDWYPHLQGVRRATYDVTLRWPKRHELLASGQVVDSGIEEGMRWERRTLDLPAIAFSFEVGAFDVHTEQIGHVSLTVGFSKTSVRSAPKATRQDVIETLGNALRFYEDRFGKYPLDYLSVATVPRGFSQGYLSLLTLSHYLMGGSNSRAVDRKETVAHELSHQWWGNKVGWYGYRDQWLSEALADFSAVSFMAQEEERASVYLARHAVGWKRALATRIADGRRVESLGPVVMGARLNSSLSYSAYQAVVYDKGSVAFHMLAQSLGPEPFSRMLGALADAVNNRAIDTETFLASIERMSGADLGEFARRFVYGTGIPDIYYTYSTKFREDGIWLVEGEVRQVTVGHDRYRLERTDADTWRVSRERIANLEVAGSPLRVPFQVSLAGAEDETTDARYGRSVTTQTGIGGAMILEGEVTEFAFPLDREPLSLWLDQRGEVLANFYCEQRQPKRMLSYRAGELAARGHYSEAERMFEDALVAPLYSADSPEQLPSKREIKSASRIRDAYIQIGRARMYLDQNRESDARTALDEIDSLLTGVDKRRYHGSRTLLRTRLLVRTGQYETAYNKLSKIIYLDFPQRDEESTSETMRRRRFSSRGHRRMSGRAYALLTVAAHETGKEAVARQAFKEAEERGADMSVLAGVVSLTED